ncbi:hypothetical protein PI126_g12042 [Phytophthora idaei]|nr:hypothetical protein PI126_g12042 [Phytophthora idaei]
MVARLVRNVKRFSFDGHHTPTVVLYSKRLSNFWNPAQHGLGTYSVVQLKQQYVLRSLGAASLSVLDNTLALTDIARCGVLDVETPRSEGLDIVDNGFYLLQQQMRRCLKRPARNSLVTSTVYADPNSQISEDSVECLGSVGPAKNPVRARYWLSWFNGYEVHVPATGQCAILDLYASATNHSRTQIELSREVVRDANRREKIINDLMITNLMDDVKLGSVNPEKELCRLNPGAEITSNPNVALAQYCTHLLHELYLRHPVLVISVDNHGDGLAQLYSYKDHTISDSDPSDPLIREIGEGPCPTRVPLNSSTRLHAHAYETLLQTADISQLSLEDSLKYAIVTVVNSEELETCCQQNRRVFVIPVEVLPDFSSETQDGLLTVARWAVTSPLVARNLFGFLPYPELSAKTIPFELLCPWGR